MDDRPKVQKKILTVSRRFNRTSLISLSSQDTGSAQWGKLD
jgi:hypothetical protein